MLGFFFWPIDQSDTTIKIKIIFPRGFETSLAYLKQFVAHASTSFVFLLPEIFDSYNPLQF